MTLRSGTATTSCVIMGPLSLHIRSPQLRDLVLKPLLATGALLQLAHLVRLLRSSRVDMLA